MAFLGIFKKNPAKAFVGGLSALMRFCNGASAFCQDKNAAGRLSLLRAKAKEYFDELSERSRNFDQERTINNFNLMLTELTNANKLLSNDSVVGRFSKELQLLIDSKKGVDAAAALAKSFSDSDEKIIRAAQNIYDDDIRALSKDKALWDDIKAASEKLLIGSTYSGPCFSISFDGRSNIIANQKKDGKQKAFYVMHRLNLDGMISLTPADKRLAALRIRLVKGIVDASKADKSENI